MFASGLLIPVLAVLSTGAAAADPASVESDGDGAITITGTEVSFDLAGSTFLLSTVMSRLQTLESKLETATGELDTAKSTITTLSTSLGKAQEQITALEDKAKTAQGEREAAGTKVTGALQDTGVLKDDVAKLKQTVAETSVGSVKFSVKGAGLCGKDDKTNRNAMTRDGVAVTLPGNGQKRGITVAAFDPVEYKLVGSAQVFDTFNPNAEDDLAKLIASLDDGAVVMASIYDEGTKSLTEVGLGALEQIGSVLIRDIKIRESWAIIGRKGAAVGSVPEDHGKASVAQPSQCQTEQQNKKWLGIPVYMPRPTRLLEEIVFTGKLGAKVTESMAERATQAALLRNDQRLHGVEIAIKGFGGCTGQGEDGGRPITNQVLVYRNGVRIPLPPLEPGRANRRGYNFYTFEPLSLQLGCDIKGLGCPTFDTYDGRESTNSSGQMLAWVQSLPVGTVVAGGIIDEGTNGMDHRGFQALELLGLTLMQTIKFRESYAFVAQVGDTRGSAVEDHGTRASGDDIHTYDRGCAYKDAYHPRPTALLRRMFFTGMTGLPLNQELGRRAGSRAMAMEFEALASIISKDMITLEAQSAGACAGNFYQVLVNGVEVKPNNNNECIRSASAPTNSLCYRGIFVVAIDGTTLETVHTRMYDLYAGDTAVYTQFYADMDALDDGTIVVAVLRDAITIKVAKKIDDAMKMIGATKYANLGLRESWAAMGVKGKPDQVQEDVGRYTQQDVPPGFKYDTTCTKEYIPRPTKVLTGTFFSKSTVDAIRAVKP